MKAERKAEIIIDNTLKDNKISNTQIIRTDSYKVPLRNLCAHTCMRVDMRLGDVTLTLNTFAKSQQQHINRAQVSNLRWQISRAKIATPDEHERHQTAAAPVWESAPVRGESS
ncbi:hypothetical protein EVAR_83902_1 [Eumeta japonica]|uniref:Uncharacterized protein n=1 Tax=Eumeta variegata TaxID=151549 RepID=A0A4C1USN9_EUMVA|nr:hypothetical protein EVAR_83902_1 [Eumeta japonica]